MAQTTAAVTPLRTGTARSAIVRVDEATEEHRAYVTVVLEWDGTEHEGEATGDPSAATRDFLVASATLSAVDSISEGRAGFQPLDVSHVTSGDTPIALVVVNDPDVDRPLVGTAVIDRSNHQIAVAKAALDAVNRRLTQKL